MLFWRPTAAISCDGWLQVANYFLEAFLCEIYLSKIQRDVFVVRLLILDGFKLAERILVFPLLKITESQVISSRNTLNHVKLFSLQQISPGLIVLL